MQRIATDWERAKFAGVKVAAEQGVGSRPGVEEASRTRWHVVNPRPAGFVRRPGDRRVNPRPPDEPRTSALQQVHWCVRLLKDDVPSIAAHRGKADMAIEWSGELDDDCTAEWLGLLLRAEWMVGDRWWWAVSDIASGEEIDSSNNDGYFEVVFTSGDAARHAAEKAAREHLQRNHR